MNIKNAVSENIVGDKLKAIFERQKELMAKYHYIEEESGLLQTPDCPVNLDDKRGQARLKDFAWRITEELGEALDALNTDHDMDHYAEELVDGLHFLTEFSILAGLDFPTLAFLVGTDEGDTLDSLFRSQTIEEVNLEEAVTRFIQRLGMACNCLKNKPWKQSQMLTDKPVFYNRLVLVWEAYFNILKLAFNDSQEVADVYLKKSQVNKFRQRSNY